MMLHALPILAIIGSLTSCVSATTYAQFCDDDNCSVNCGISVSVNNPGCLIEKGRHSVKFHGVNLENVSLVTTPGDNCACQNYCYTNVVGSVDTATRGCLPLTGPSAESFRFVGEQTCREDNC